MRISMYAIMITIVSFLLEGLFSCYIPISTHFWLPIPTLLSICFCQVYFLKKRNYIYFCFLFGILYDITFTNTLFLHGILFVIMGYIGQKIVHFFAHTWYYFLLMIFILILIYRMLSYAILVSIGYLPFDFSFFLSITMGSFLWNLIYGILLYILEHFVFKRFLPKRWF